MKGLSMKFSVCSLPPRNPRLPTFPLSAASPDKAKVGLLGCSWRTSSPRSDCRRVRIGRGVRHLCLWRLSFVASPPTLTSLFISTNLQHKFSPFRWPQRLCRWADRLQASPRRRAVVTTLATLVEARSVSASPFGASIRPLLVELGPDHLDRHLMVVHFDEFPQFVRVFKPALPLQTLEDRAYQVVSTNLQVGLQFESTREILARAPSWRAGPKHLGLAGVRTFRYDQERVAPVELAAACRAPPVPLFSPPSFFCHRAPLRPTRFDLEAGIDDSEGTRTTR